MSNIPTPHNQCDDKNKIAKLVLMPGDPLRAKYIADNFLTEVETFSTVRNIYGFTGKFNGRRVSVMASGMGMPSIGIYAYELFSFYDVDTIIRIGSAGSYDANLDIYDTIVVKDAYSDSTFAKVAYGYKAKIMKPTKSINNRIKKCAKDLNIDIKEERIYSSDVFYSTTPERWKEIKNKYGTMAVEMESFALFATANALGKNAACILTISDSLVSDKKTSSLERERNLNDMIKIALGMTKYYK